MKKERAKNEETQDASHKQLKKQTLECVCSDRLTLKVQESVQVLIKLPLPPAMAVFLPTVTVTAVAATTIFPVGTTAHG